MQIIIYVAGLLCVGALFACVLEIRRLRAELFVEQERKIRYYNDLRSARIDLGRLERMAVSMRRLLPIVAMVGWLLGGSIAMAQVQSIVSNGQLQNRDFTILLIHGDDPISSQVHGMMTAPQTEQLQRWSIGLHLRPMRVSESFVQQHHQDLLNKHQNQLPIIALVDTSGGVWWSAAAGQIPLREPDLVTQLAIAYKDTFAAALKQTANPGTPAMVPPSAQSFGVPAFPAQSRFLDRGVAAPEPVRSQPSVNITTTQQPLHPQHSSGDDATLLLVGVLCVVCSLILAAAPVIGSTIIANAMTDEHDDAA